MKILIIEDDETILEVYGFYIEVTLGESKFDVCRSGKEAIQKVKETDYDIIFLDNGLLDMSGSEVAKEIKETSNVLVVSGDISDRLMSTYKKMGINQFIEKPIAIEEFKVKVDEIISHSDKK